MGLPQEKTIILTVLLCSSIIVGIVGLILGAVSLSRKGVVQYTINAQTSDSASATRPGNSEKTWLMAIGHYDNNVEYLDSESYTIRGYNVDIIDAVCDIANRNCELVWDLYENCWDSQSGQRPRGGPGLMGGWYDACTGWVQTSDRLLTYAFTTPFDQSSKIAIFVKKGNPLGIPATSLTNRKVGFLDGWFSDEHCLARYGSSTSTFDIRGADLPSNNVVHYQNPDLLIDAVTSGSVDAAFASRLPQLESALLILTDDTFPNLCEAGGASMMTHKRNVEFITWWNNAFNRLLGTNRYQQICNDIRLTHGHIDGDDPEDICL